MKFIYNLKKTCQFKLLVILFVSNSLVVLESLSKQIYKNELLNNDKFIYRNSKSNKSFLEKYPLLLSEIIWKKTNEGKKLVFCHVKKDDKEQEVFLRSIR